MVFRGGLEVFHVGFDKFSCRTLFYFLAMLSNRKSKLPNSDKTSTQSTTENFQNTTENFHKKLHIPWLNHDSNTNVG